MLLFLFFTGCIATCILSRIIYQKCGYIIAAKLQGQTNFRQHWIGCTMVLAIFCGFMLVLSTSTVCVITEDTYGKPEVCNKQVALWYSYKDSGQTIKKFVGMSNGYIHNMTNKRLIMYSVGYGNDMYNRTRVISIPSQTFMECKYSPSIYFEEAPASIYKTKYESSTRWVIDYEDKFVKED